MKKNYHFSVRRLTASAILIAMSVVIGIFCKSVLNFGNGLFRITFENLPIILSGMLFGPVAGGVVGATSDLLSYLLSSQVYPPNLIVTLGSSVIGVSAGLVARYFVTKRGTRQIAFAASLAHIIGSMIIKSIGLFQFYGWAVLVRIPLYFVIAGIEIWVLSLIYRKSVIKNLIESFDKEKI